MKLTLSPGAYERYSQEQHVISNERIRADDVSFLDAMLSEEADFTQTPEGKEIIETIKAL
jgi:hypothetical protein